MELSEQAQAAQEWSSIAIVLSMSLMVAVCIVLMKLLAPDRKDY